MHTQRLRVCACMRIEACAQHVWKRGRGSMKKKPCVNTRVITQRVLSARCAGIRGGTGHQGCQLVALGTVRSHRLLRWETAPSDTSASVSRAVISEPCARECAMCSSLPRMHTCHCICFVVKGMQTCLHVQHNDARTAHMRAHPWMRAQPHLPPLGCPPGRYEEGAHGRPTAR